MYINKKKQYTLDTKHKEYIKHFKSNKKDLIIKKKELSNIIDKIEILEKTEKKENYLEIKTNLTIQKEELETIINNIDNHKDEIDYFNNIYHILNDYYIPNEKSTKEDDEYIDKTDNNNNNEFEENISEHIKYFYNLENTSNNSDNTDNSDNSDNSDNIDEIDDTLLLKKKINMNNFIKTTKNNPKGNLLDEYMCILDKSYISNAIPDKNDMHICKQCNIPTTILHSDGIIVCNKCGLSNNILIDCNKPSYKEPLNESTYFCYKRINHFNEWLSQFQAKESTEIPNYVFDQLLFELKKLRVTDIKKLTPDKVREILKKYKLNKYYEHVPHIINKISGLPPPIMSREIEEKLRSMFKEIQEPFMEICPKNRKNFLSYSYVLHKMCELLELDEFLICFPLLKSREKLHNQDIMWKKITHKLNWEFIPSI